MVDQISPSAAGRNTLPLLLKTLEEAHYTERQKWPTTEAVAQVYDLRPFRGSPPRRGKLRAAPQRRSSPDLGIAEAERFEISELPPYIHRPDDLADRRAYQTKLWSSAGELLALRPTGIGVFTIRASTWLEPVVPRTQWGLPPTKKPTGSAPIPVASFM